MLHLKGNNRNKNLLVLTGCNVQVLGVNRYQNYIDAWSDIGDTNLSMLPVYRVKLASTCN
jgi:hypothetical protein